MMFCSWFLYMSGLSPGVVVSKLRWRLSVGTVGSLSLLWGMLRSLMKSLLMVTCDLMVPLVYSGLSLVRLP